MFENFCIEAKNQNHFNFFECSFPCIFCMTKFIKLRNATRNKKFDKLKNEEASNKYR